MSKLKTYSEFVNEGLIDAIKNPIKFRQTLYLLYTTLGYETYSKATTMHYF
jgi:cytochrome c oxidase assembly factor CtaG